MIEENNGMPLDISEGREGNNHLNGGVKKQTRGSRVWLYLLLGFLLIPILLPLIGFIFCVVVMAVGLIVGTISSFFYGYVILPLSFVSSSIICFSLFLPKKMTKKKAISLLPYGILVVFFFLLYLGEIVHQNTNVCSLVSETTLLTGPLLSFLGMVFSGVFFISNARKI